MLRTGVDVYPHRTDLSSLSFWVCPTCGARVGCHPGTKRPLGIPANAELRRARLILHERLLDPLWQNAPARLYGKPGRRRNLVYKFLAHRLGLTRDETHTGQFGLELCRLAWRTLFDVLFSEVEQYHQEEKRRLEKESKRVVRERHRERARERQENEREADEVRRLLNEYYEACDLEDVDVTEDYIVKLNECLPHWDPRGEAANNDGWGQT